jgi:hypothetical protein
MVAMTPSRATPSLGLQFNAFLFASIDEGASEARLSVVSALARLDLDPWQQAAELTQLPRETAVQRLAALLSNLPGDDLAHSDSQTISQRLIALLPLTGGPASGAPPQGGSGTAVRIDLTLIMTLFVLMSVFAMANSGRTDHPAPAPAPASATAPPVASTNPSLAKAQP